MPSPVVRYSRFGASVVDPKRLSPGEAPVDRRSIAESAEIRTLKHRLVFDATACRITKLRQHKDQARAMAMKAAKEKATALAETLDARIGRVYSITENASGWSSSYRQWWRDNRVWSASNTAWEAPGEGGHDDDSIAPGQIRVTASVEVSFDLD